MELRIEDLQPIEELMCVTTLGSHGLMDMRPTLALSHYFPKPADPVPGIDRVIFNDPATIVIWLDGTKTIVKCQEGDTFDEQTGLALCFMKKALGNSSRKFNDILHAYVPARFEMEMYADNKLVETI